MDDLSVVIAEVRQLRVAVTTNERNAGDLTIL